MNIFFAKMENIIADIINTHNPNCYNLYIYNIHNILIGGIATNSGIFTHHLDNLVGRRNFIILAENYTQNGGYCVLRKAF